MMQEHYAAGLEAPRLSRASGRLELARTLEILARYLPAPPARILDVGGGPGVYALSLLEQGYEVDLVDPVPLHVQQAAQVIRVHGHRRGRAHLGDARSLDFADASADAILLLGPLYHLTDREDRVRAFAEARRVARPGGVVIAAAISRFASLLDGYFHGHIDDAAFVPLVERDLADGQHRNPTDRPHYFTTAYFHDPTTLHGEVDDAGLTFESLLAVEGPFWCVPDFDALWEDEGRRALMLGFLRTIEREPSILGASAHILVVARRERN
jgi:SAM-dependent methyltransferase